jgi:hypothetical protein
MALNQKPASKIKLELISELELLLKESGFADAQIISKKHTIISISKGLIVKTETKNSFLFANAIENAKSDQIRQFKENLSVFRNNHPDEEQLFENFFPKQHLSKGELFQDIFLFGLKDNTDFSDSKESILSKISSKSFGHHDYKNVMFIFWASWNLSSIKFIEETLQIKRINISITEKDLKLVLVSVDSKAKEALNVIIEKGWRDSDIEMFWADDWERDNNILGNKYNINYVPQVLIFDEMGVIRYIGNIYQQNLEAKLLKYLNNSSCSSFWSSEEKSSQFRDKFLKFYADYIQGDTTVKIQFKKIVRYPAGNVEFRKKEKKRYKPIISVQYPREEGENVGNLRRELEKNLGEKPGIVLKNWNQVNRGYIK